MDPISRAQCACVRVYGRFPVLDYGRGRFRPARVQCCVGFNVSVPSVRAHCLLPCFIAVRQGKGRIVRQQCCILCFRVFCKRLLQLVVFGGN